LKHFIVGNNNIKTCNCIFVHCSLCLFQCLFLSISLPLYLSRLKQLNLKVDTYFWKCFIVKFHKLHQTFSISIKKHYCGVVAHNSTKHLWLYSFSSYRQPSLYAVFLSVISSICDPEMASFLEPILWFRVILGLFICKFVIFEPIFGVPISRI